MGETRVNLAHLLRDLRDSYPFPLEEAIITELTANSLDSRASQMLFQIDSVQGTFTLVDDGLGMSREEFDEYHDIAATAKEKGKGIGFAGLGAKLALLICEFVLTETKSRSYHSATKWRLESKQRAPWDFIPPPGLVRGFSGTGVQLYVQQGAVGHLVSADYVEEVLVRHFHPLLDPQFSTVLKHAYRRGVQLFVNGHRVALPTLSSLQLKGFIVKLGRGGKPVGVGFLRKSAQDLPEECRGLAVSTYGKVIKRGWDWIGLVPKSPTRVAGLVEIPALAEILTTNKADFLRDPTSLQKYYRYRKGVQEAIHPILAQMGEITTAREKPEDLVRPLEKEVERILQEILPEFPELDSLLSRRQRAEPQTGVLEDPTAPPIGVRAPGVETITGTYGSGGSGAGVEAIAGQLPGERIEPSSEPEVPGTLHTGRRRRPGLMIGFETDPSREELGWLTGNTVWINTAHKAYDKAAGSGFKNYHALVTVAWVLSSFVGEQKSPHQFINRFLSWWGS